MSTLSELHALRAAAGQAYADAAAAYVAAFDELHAYDLAVGNRNVGGQALPTFNIRPAVLPHPVYLPAPGALNNVSAGDALAARVEQIIATFEPG